MLRKRGGSWTPSQLKTDTEGGRGRGGPRGRRGEGEERNLGKVTEAGVGLGDAGEKARRETLEKSLRLASQMPKQKAPRELRLRGPCLRAMTGPRPNSKSVKLGPQTALARLHGLPCS